MQYGGGVELKIPELSGGDCSATSRKICCFAGGEQHDDTLVADTKSVLSEWISEVPKSVGTVVHIVNVQDIFLRMVCVMKALPAFFRGAYRSACESCRRLSAAWRHGSREVFTSPAFVVDKTFERRQGPQEQVVRAGPEVCSRQPIAFEKETHPT